MFIEEKALQPKNSRARRAWAPYGGGQCSCHPHCSQGGLEKEEARLDGTRGGDQPTPLPLAQGLGRQSIAEGVFWVQEELW